MEQQQTQQPKLTRGDKCILLHIAVTLLLILILATIYFVHLCVVDHITYYDTVKVMRRGLEEDRDFNEDNDQLSVPSYTSVGAAYINISPPKVICSTILLKQQWSLAPAHCVSIRSDPEISQYLPKWRIRYKEDGYKETDIKRGIMHSFFNKDDFDNNVGLFEHLDRVPLPDLDFPNKSMNEILEADPRDFFLVGWDRIDAITSNPVRPLKSAKCAQFSSPIVEVTRKSELCVNMRDEYSTVVHGAALVLKSEIVGLFSWGDRYGAVPRVVLSVAPYKTWLMNMMEMRTET